MNGLLPSHAAVVATAATDPPSTDRVSSGGAPARISAAVQTEASPEMLSLQHKEFVCRVEAVKTVSRATQTEPAEMWLHGHTVETRDMGVGEHLSGEPFLWQGIFDMP